MLFPDAGHSTGVFFFVLKFNSMTQAEALQILKSGANVFLTGAPGAGKTYVLNQYTQYLREHDIPVAITASTGIAATHIGGVTIHSWSGIGVRENISDMEADALEDKKYLWSRYEKTKVLVIDEISMLSAGVLDSVNKVCKGFKRNPAPFGGLQVVLVGDFFQLPPITKKGEETKFAFESQAWRELNPIVLYLTEQHRQEDDTLLSILGRIRRGDIEDEFVDLYDRLNIDLPDTTRATKLYTHNADVDGLNAEELEKLEGDEHYYEMETHGKENHVDKLVMSCLSPENLCLKLGAVVMCTKNNFEQGYVNGTLGEVSDFDPDTDYPIITTNDGRSITIEPDEWSIQDGDKVLASINQIPLRLAWAITVHKSQGMSLDAAVIDLGRAFEFGQGYVALSRVRTLNGLSLLGFNANALMVHPKIMDEDARLQKKSEDIAIYLGKKSEAEMKKSHEDFIVRAGGSLAVIDVKAREAEEKRTSTFEKTRNLILEGKSINDIATERGLTKETVVSHLEKLIEMGLASREKLEYLKPKGKKFNEIVSAFQTIYDKSGELHLTPVKNKIRGASYFDIQLARVFLNR